MRLNYSSTSPFARKARIVMSELGLDSRVELVRTNPRENVDALRPLNPLGKIPVLTTDDGTLLYDSRVICEYLDTEFGDRRFFPASSGQRWNTLALQSLADGLLEAGMLLRAETAREKQQAVDTVEWQTGKIEAALARLDEILPRLDDDFTIGPVACVCAIGYLDFRLPQFGFVERRNNIRLWANSMAKRPSVQATVPKLS